MSDQSKIPAKAELQIREAFIDLLEERGFYNINVKNIIERAKVGRTTFYLHFQDKYDLMDKIEKEQIDNFVVLMGRVRKSGIGSLQSPEMEEGLDIFQSYFEYVRDNSQIWLILTKDKGIGGFNSRLSRAIFEVHRETIKEWNVVTDPNIPHKLSPIMTSWTYVGLISYWLDTGMREEPREMALALRAFWHRYLKPMDDGGVKTEGQKNAE